MGALKIKFDVEKVFVGYFLYSLFFMKMLLSGADMQHAQQKYQNFLLRCPSFNRKKCQIDRTAGEDEQNFAWGIPLNICGEKYLGLSCEI